MDKSLWRKFNIENLPSEKMKDIAKECGIQTAVNLMIHFPGETIRVPKKIQRNVIREFIDEGLSPKEISRMLDVSEKTVYNRLNCFKKKRNL